MWPDRVSKPEPLTFESGALPTALRGPASKTIIMDLTVVNINSLERSGLPQAELCPRNTVIEFSPLFVDN